MFDNQFDSAQKIKDVSEDQVFLYAAETSLQIYITELSEPLRDLYVTACSLQSTSEYIYSSTAERLPGIFEKYMPEAVLKDYHEMDIASAGIIRAFMARPCDIYFTIEGKIIRVLSSVFMLYSVSKEKAGGSDRGSN